MSPLRSFTKIVRDRGPYEGAKGFGAADASGAALAVRAPKRACQRPIEDAPKTKPLRLNFTTTFSCRMALQRRLSLINCLSKRRARCSVLPVGQRDDERSFWLNESHANHPETIDGNERELFIAVEASARNPFSADILAFGC